MSEIVQDDYAILEQESALIDESHPLVGDLESLDTILEEYKENDLFTLKIQVCSSIYSQTSTSKFEFGKKESKRYNKRTKGCILIRINNRFFHQNESLDLNFFLLLYP